MNMALAEDVPEQLPEAVFQVDDDVLKLLAEIGLSAAARGCSEAARPIFDALALFRPGHPLAAIGRALGEISAGRPEEAIAGLRSSGVSTDSCPDEIQAVLLIALCLAGQQVEASQLCRKLLNGGQGPSRQIALRLKPTIDAGLGK
jgi:hypothetical protein